MCTRIFQLNFTIMDDEALFVARTSFTFTQEEDRWIIEPVNVTNSWSSQNNSQAILGFWLGCST